MIEWEDFLARLRRLNSVALRVDSGEELVDLVSREKLQSHSSRQADMDETKVVEEISLNWIASSNPKVSRLGIDLLNEAVNNLGRKFRSILTKVSDQLIAKFGNERTQDAALQMFINIFVVAYDGPDPAVYERLLNQAWNDRVWRVREGGCHLLRHTLEQTMDNGHFNGQACQIGLSKVMTGLLKLAGDDKQSEVREAAMDALSRGYECFGEKLRNDIVKRHPNRLQQILARLDEVEPSGQVQAAFKTPSRPASREGHTQRFKSNTLGRRRTPQHHGNGDLLQAGAVGVADLEHEFTQNLPDMRSFDTSSLNSRIDTIHQRLTSPKTEWEDRNLELRLIRALCLEQLLPSGSEFRKFAPSFEKALSDLRSQVTREACVTLGLLSRELESTNFGPMAHLGVIQQLIKLIPNSAKIMSSSASACLSIILRECPYSKFPPHFTEQLLISRSVQIRRKCIECISQILAEWDGNVIYKSNEEIVKAVTKTLQDADSDVRKTAREAFFFYQNKFPDESDEIRTKASRLPANVKKILSTAPISRSNSNDSLASTKSDGGLSSRVPRIPRSVAPKSKMATPRVPRAPSATRKAPAVVARPVSRPGFGRSHSDLDPSSTRKFGVFTGGFNTPKKYSNIESRYSQKTYMSPKPKPSTPTTRTGLRSGYSQPGSRSSSPPSAQKQRRTPSRIPRSSSGSANPSREASPEDFNRHNRRILPMGAAGQRILSDALLHGFEQIKPSEATTMLNAAKTTAEKKDALNQIGKIVDQRQKLTTSEQRKMTEAIQKIIYNGKENILIPTFKVIPRILKTYANDEPMKDWLYGLLTGILKRLSSLLGDNREAALEVLDSIRSEYPKELLYARVTKFLLDQSTTPTNGQKAAILRFLRDLAPTLEGSTVRNSAETRLVISRLVGWSNDQKSAEVRQEASAAIRALFSLNPAQFAAALQELPKPFQEGANKALRAIGEPSYGGGDYGTRSPEVNLYPRSQSSMAGYSSGSSFLTPAPPQSQPTSKFLQNSCDLTPVSTEGSSIKSEFESVTERINNMTLSAHYPDDNFMGDDDEFLMNEKTIQLDELDSTCRVLEQIPDTTNRAQQSLLLDAIKLFQRNDAEAGVKTVRDAIKETTSGDEWDKQWPRVYPILLELASDSQKHDELRLRALHCLRDAVNIKPELMVSNAEDIVNKYLRIMASDHDDRQNRNVSRASQNAAMSLLGNITIWRALSILAQHVSEPVPVGRDSIDLCRLLVEEKRSLIQQDQLDSQTAQSAIHQLLPQLMRQWRSDSAAVRKAVVYCLVVMYTARAEMVDPYLAQATPTNKRLFELYLKKQNSR